MDNSLNSYVCLTAQEYTIEDYSIVPIRFEDRMDILKWRNEQMYHLRQEKLLTKEDQNNYFENVVSKLFDQEQPNQILFSFLKDDKCIGYGGLVHINWIDKHAEISFIMDTELEDNNYAKIWDSFLTLIERLAFEDAKLHKIQTYAYDLRPHLYPIFEQNGFSLDGVLREHKLIEGKFADVVIHSKLNEND